jgi:hypothetical protein
MRQYLLDSTPLVADLNSRQIAGDTSNPMLHYSL